MGAAIGVDGDNAATAREGNGTSSGHPFASADEATTAVLRLVTIQLGMRAAFLARATAAVDHTAWLARVEVLASHAEPGGYALAAGDAMTIPVGTAPLLIEDAREIARALGGAAQGVPTFGCFASVPVTLAAGEQFGILCGADPAPRTYVRHGDGELLGTLARLLATALAYGREGAAGAVEATKHDPLARTSHAFRTPLTVVQGFSEILRDEDLTPDEVKEYAADINKHARRLSQIVDELLGGEG